MISLIILQLATILYRDSATWMCQWEPGFSGCLEVSICSLHFWSLFFVFFHMTHDSRRTIHSSVVWSEASWLCRTQDQAKKEFPTFERLRGGGRWWIRQTQIWRCHSHWIGRLVDWSCSQAFHRLVNNFIFCIFQFLRNAGALSYPILDSIAK